MAGGSIRRGVTILTVMGLMSVFFAVALLYHVSKPLRLRAVKQIAVARSDPGSGSNGFVSALNQRWMTWTSIDSPGKYRSCVPYPKPDGVFARELSGGLVAEDANMTIPRCLEQCISLEYTYAGLTRGTQCYCTNVQNTSSLLTYVDNSHCNIPCGGDRQHDCGGKQLFSLYRTSIPDPRCCNIALGKKGAYPLIALASYPRSGNTWTRQLIEGATGVYTGSVYWTVERKAKISQQVFKGGNVDFKDKRTICVKSHKKETDHIKQFAGAVLIIRNPYRTLVAEVFRRIMFENSNSSSMANAVKYFKSEEWQKFVDTESRGWHEMNIQWIKNAKKLFVVHYEQLESDTKRQLTSIVQFLNPRLQDQNRISCAVQENPSSLSTGVSLGNHGVKTRAYLTTDPFTPSMHTTLDAFILSVNESLVARRQTPLPKDYSNVKVY